jgi:hypothetical protein
MQLIRTSTGSSCWTPVNRQSASDRLEPGKAAQKRAKCGRRENGGQRRQALRSTDVKTRVVRKTCHRTEGWRTPDGRSGRQRAPPPASLRDLEREVAVYLMRVDGDRMPFDVVGSRWQRLDDRHDKLSLVLWVSGRNCRLDESAAVVLDGQPREFRDDILGKGQSNLLRCRDRGALPGITCLEGGMGIGPSADETAHQDRQGRLRNLAHRLSFSVRTVWAGFTFYERDHSVEAVLALPDRPLVIVIATIPIMVRAAVPVVVTSGMRSVMPAIVPSIIWIPVQLVVLTIVPTGVPIAMVAAVPIVLAGLIPAILVVMGACGLR